MPAPARPWVVAHHPAACLQPGARIQDHTVNQVSYHYTIDNTVHVVDIVDTDPAS